MDSNDDDQCSDKNESLHDRSPFRMDFSIMTRTYSNLY